MQAQAAVETKQPKKELYCHVHCKNSMQAQAAVETDFLIAVPVAEKCK